MKIHWDSGRIGFHKDREIIPFIDENWDVISDKPKPLKTSWHGTVSKTLLRDKIFINDGNNGDGDEVAYALRSNHLDDLFNIAPNYDNLKTLSRIDNNAANNAQLRSARNLKKRPAPNVPSQDANGEPLHVNKRHKSELSQPKLPPGGFPTDFPFNKDDYRYVCK